MDNFNYYVDEIKNQNFNIRIFHAKRILTIFELLSFEDLLTKFIPFIVENIIKFESNEEVLTEYAKNIKDFIMFTIQNKPNNIEMNDVIEINNLLFNTFYLKFFQSDDEIIRENAVNSFIFLIKESLKYEMLIEPIKIILNVDKNTPHNNKICYCYIYPYFYQVITIHNNLFDQYLNAYTFLLKNVDKPSIRRFSMENADKIFQFLNNDENSYKILKLINERCLNLIDDPIEIIRINTINTGSKLCQFLKNYHYKDFLNINDLIIKFQSSFKKYNSWRMKCALINSFYENSDLFDSNFIDTVLIQNFKLTLLNEQEAEPKIYILEQLYKLPNLFPNKFNTIFIPIFQNNILLDKNMYIRIALSNSLIKIISYQEFDNTISNNIQKILLMLLEDNIFDVSINVIKSFKIEKFNIKFCINLIEQASKFSQWRIRYEAIKKLKEIISNLIENNETNIDTNSLIELIYYFYHDKANDIRSVSVEILDMLLNKNLININKELWTLQKEILDTNLKYTLQIFVLKSIKHFYNYYTSEIKENEIKPIINNKVNSPINNIQNEAAILFDYINSI
jgi:hypothetical protein